MKEEQTMTFYLFDQDRRPHTEDKKGTTKKKEGVEELRFE